MEQRLSRPLETFDWGHRVSRQFATAEEANEVKVDSVYLRL